MTDLEILSIVCMDNEDIDIKEEKNMCKNCYKVREKGYDNAQKKVEQDYFVWKDALFETMNEKHFNENDIDCNSIIKKKYTCHKCNNIIKFKYNTYIILKKANLFKGGNQHIDINEKNKDIEVTSKKVMCHKCDKLKYKGYGKITTLMKKILSKENFEDYDYYIMKQYICDNCHNLIIFKYNPCIMWKNRLSF